MIREAVADDIPELVEMLERLHAGTWRVGAFDVQAVRETLLRLMSGENSVVLRSEGGLFSGHIQPAWFSPSWLIALEISWWAEDGRWLALLSAFGAWAADRGVDEVRMVSTIGPKSHRIRRVLDRYGYVPQEIGYRKVM